MAAPAQDQRETASFLPEFAYGCGTIPGTRYAAAAFGYGAQMSIAVGIGIGAAGGAAGFLAGAATVYVLNCLEVNPIAVHLVALAVQTVVSFLITGLIATFVLGSVGAGMLFAAKALTISIVTTLIIMLIAQAVTHFYRCCYHLRSA